MGVKGTKCEWQQLLYGAVEWRNQVEWGSTIGCRSDKTSKKTS